MITKIEMQYMEAVIEMNRRQRNIEIDWEQRRYEIAKEVMPVIYEQCVEVFKSGQSAKCDDVAKGAVKFADLLIEELKKGK